MTLATLRTSLCKLCRLVILIVAAATFASPALAEETCGDGSTFSVSLPRAGGSGDTLTLPAGCRVYALFVSGYTRNPGLDELTFYNAAKFILENDGYVHWAWWNNLLKEYMARPLHPDDTVINPLTGQTLGASPGGIVTVHWAGFVPLVHEPGILPKAVPEEDRQFQADARRMLEAIRQHNPDALIVVAGHSMGGNAVARLGANTGVDIDLLAPIDPVGNRSIPVGRPTADDPRPDRAFNWTRWRATREFSGYRVRDCVRVLGIGPCQNFGTFLNPQYQCRTIGPLLDMPPPFPGTLAPGYCPGPWMDPGTRLVFGGNIKRLYHRWQNEAIFPFDFHLNEYYVHWAPRNPGGGLLNELNSQRPVPMCSGGVNPLDPERLCNPGDGHGEIVGMPDAVEAKYWPEVAEPMARRQRIIDMRDAGDDWRHRPENPDLDRVSAGMVQILSHLLADQVSGPVPPTTVATLMPEANERGWHNEELTVVLRATPGRAGAPVVGIEVALEGAQSGALVQDGDFAEFSVSGEGYTTITYAALDSAGNREGPQQITVRLDRTPPHIVTTVDPEPNAFGWHNGHVTVTFNAVDALSGVDFVSAPVMVSVDGQAQEIIGVAEDLAGNTAATSVEVNLDTTPPELSGLPDADCVLWPPDNRMIHVATVQATDSLSGIVPETLRVDAASDESPRPGARVHEADAAVTHGDVRVRASRNGNGSGRIYTVNASVEDYAGNSAFGRATCVVPHNQGRR